MERDAITMVILGAGDRGRTYAAYAAAYPQKVKVVGVADINPAARAAVAQAHGLGPEAQWGDWSEAVAAKPKCDVMVIAMPDALHVEPAIACLDAGYHLLLEKPMARTWAECERLAAKIPIVSAANAPAKFVPLLYWSKRCVVLPFGIISFQSV